MTEGREFLLEAMRVQQSGIVRVCAILWRVRRKARIHARVCVCRASAASA